MKKPIHPQSPQASIQKTMNQPTTGHTRTGLGAPPIHRPQLTPQGLQSKASPVQPPPMSGSNRSPAAAPVYRPQPAPKVLQQKVANAQPQRTGGPTSGVKPPVNAQSRGVNPNLAPRSAHQPPNAQAKMAPQRDVQHRAAQPGKATPQGRTVQRQSNGDVQPPFVQRQSSAPPSSPFDSPAAVIQAKGGAGRRRWTDAQREQSRKFWEKKERRLARQEEGQEARLLRTQRANLVQIVDSDERYFTKYLKTRKPLATVYRGDGRGVHANSLNGLVLTDVNPKPGASEISFFGVVDHTHSNASPGGMVSTTSDMQGAIDWAVDTHKYGLVYEIQISDYIDVNALLAARNFRNRYEGQHEYLIPRKIFRNEIKKVHLYQKGPNGGIRVATKTF